METRPGNCSDLAGQTAVVTGGSHGVGSGICRELGRQGSRVVVNGRIDVNLTSAFLTLRQFVPPMAERRSGTVVISSTSHAVRRVNH
jgi:NAD(P)-dependent dehydrogenase (short-subunit alcohol dehydrogenase family)